MRIVQFTENIFDSSFLLSMRLTSFSSSLSWLMELGWGDRFVLLECIGSGGMGHVWRARERGTDRIVALKTLDPSKSGDDHLLARLDIEAATLIKLRDAGQHEHIVPIIDYKVSETHACLVMEFIPGLNLRKWCDTHQLSLTKRVELMAHIARATGWFHALDVIHRDLKPTNILVSAVTHQPVIVDFSIAKLDDTVPLTLTNEALGTAPYMAPEQIDRNRGGIGPATDVYALGVTLYELLTHILPHPGELPQIIQRHQNEVRPARPSLINKEVPRDLESIVLKALSHRPTDRYSDGAALAEDLERFLEGRPVHARPMSTLLHVVRQARRKPALTAALAACTVIGSFAIWNLHRQAVQQEVFTLETQLATAMQQVVWGEGSLSTAESTLLSLAQHDAALASALRQRLQQDVVRDTEDRLQQPRLLNADFTWLRDMAGWLRPRLPEPASRLESLITERAGRWETQAELRPPFADLQGLFPRSRVYVENNLLRVSHNQSNSNPPGIVITDSVSVPMEIDCTFLAAGDSFHHIVFGFLHKNAMIEARLYKAKYTADSIQRRISSATLDSESYVLYFTQNSEFRHGLHIPDAHLLEQPFRLTLRVEQDRAEATLNGRWVVQLDSPFALGSVQPNNFCRVSWPTDIVLQHLALRTRRADAISPLEEADNYAAQGQWASARRLYENLRGDPHFGSEANFKIALCLWHEGERAAARTEWEKFIPRSASAWRDRSLLHLSMFTLLNREWDTASRYLHLLPEHLQPSTLRQLDGQITSSLFDLLSATSLKIVEPRTDRDAVATITQAFRVLQTPPLVLANRLGMPQHFAGQDGLAKSLYAKGLSARNDFASEPEGLTAASNCLDQWCRLNPSETDDQLAAALELWRGSTNGRAIWLMEQARAAARSGHLRKAIGWIREAREKPEKLDNRLHTSLWLLEGMLYRLQNAEDRAQSAWRKAKTIAATVTQRHPLHLFDSMMLHSLTQGWERNSAGDLLNTLASRHLPQEDRPAAQIVFGEAFLTDPAWITTFNAVLQDERGRAYAEDYILCRQPPRALFQCFYRLVLDHYFLSTAIPQATAEQSTRVRQIVDRLVTEMSVNPHGEIEHLYDYLRAWNEPDAAGAMFDQASPYSPALIEEMKWLLQQRHLCNRLVFTPRRLASPAERAEAAP